MESLDHRFARCATQSVLSMTIRLALLLCTGVMLSCTSSADAMPSLQRGRIILIRGNPGEPLHLPARVDAERVLLGPPGHRELPADVERARRLSERRRSDHRDQQPHLLHYLPR